MAKLNMVTRPASRVLAMYYRLFSQRFQRIQEVTEDSGGYRGLRRLQRIEEATED